jgi:hypothetical protein
MEQVTDDTKCIPRTHGFEGVDERSRSERDVGAGVDTCQATTIEVGAKYLAGKVESF